MSSSKWPSFRRTTAGVIGGLVGLVALGVIAAMLITAALTPAIALTSAGATSAITTFDNLPSKLQINKLQLPTTIYAKDPSTGKQKVLTSFYDQNRVPVTFTQVAPVMYDAILSSEDPRFYNEGGIDLNGTARAILSNVRGDSDLQGGSTISQQYVKNVLVQDCYATVEDQKGLTQDKREAELRDCYVQATNDEGPDGYARKLQEMRYAIALSQRYSKNDILVGYLNIANFGGVTYGIEAAAEYYFGVHAKDLSLSQAATLAGMVQNPNTYRIDLKANEANGEANHYALTKKRQQYVLHQMLEEGKITQDQYEKAVKAPITPHITYPKSGCALTDAPYFCEYVTSIIRNDPAFGKTAADREQALRQGGLNVYTTLDWRLQRVAQSTVSKYAPAKQSGFTYGSTIVNVQPSTGAIMSIAQNTHYDVNAAPGKTSIVYAGGYDQGNKYGFAPGSSFKLFTLLAWLQAGHSLNEVVNGTVRVIPHLKNSCQGDWTNFSNTVVGNYRNEPGVYSTPMKFTAESLNSGFFGMATELDLCKVAKDATALGVTYPNGDPVEMTTQTSVIGNTKYGVSPIAMAGAYAAIANHGTFCKPFVISKVTDSDGKDLPVPDHSCKQVIDPKIAATAEYALQGVMRGIGTAAIANPNDGTPVFGKTGTNEGNQTWLITSSTAMTSLVWSGAVDSGSRKMEDIDLFHNWYRGNDLADIRYAMSRKIQSTADEYYPGAALDKPDAKLLVYSNPYYVPPVHKPSKDKDSDKGKDKGSDDKGKDSGSSDDSGGSHGHD
ncbi:penicillin-binding protein [Microbacterium protaetiae]|uniref:Penicillin-binding protein n=1 Tax=Microbacterium protaetiae TaxID=2509458 RepID=A0A4P6E9T9_9MICO|nr:transglycosylase domain-containing protein [Microbacterium protaetiae]QAY58795.1 penicillin-binding protein [Microbacterium protaetiae]